MAPLELVPDILHPTTLSFSDRTSLSEHTPFFDEISSPFLYQMDQMEHEARPAARPAGLRGFVARLDRIGPFWWLTILLSTLFPLAGLAIWGSTHLQKECDIHHFVRFWGVGIWPGLVSTIVGSLPACIRACKAGPRFDDDAKLRFYQDIFCRVITFTAISFLASGITFSDHARNKVDVCHGH